MSGKTAVEFGITLQFAFLLLSRPYISRWGRCGSHTLVRFVIESQHHTHARVFCFILPFCQVSKMTMSTLLTRYHPHLVCSPVAFAKGTIYTILHRLYSLLLLYIVFFSLLVLHLTGFRPSILDSCCLAFFF